MSFCLGAQKLIQNLQKYFDILSICFYWLYVVILAIKEMVFILILHVKLEKY